jgi:SAM-dependent methyltransferase
MVQRSQAQQRNADGNESAAMDDPRQLIRTAYDTLGEAYLAGREGSAGEQRLLADFMARLPDGARVLDAGCGAGVPVASALSTRFRVTGVDISPGQVARARALVPQATFHCADMTALDFPAGSFDGICSLYAIIHIPRKDHPTLLRAFYRLLVPGGLVLLVLGASDIVQEVEEDWLGAGAPMYWSHYDQTTNLRLLREAGFTVLREELVVEDDAYGGGRHLFVIGMRDGNAGGEAG